MRVLSATVLAAIVISAAAVLLLRQPVLARRATLPVHADAARLRAHVEFLTGAARPRNADHPDQLRVAAAYIATSVRESGGVVEEQEFAARGRTYRNVLAYFGPQDRNTPLLVVGAHYDAFGAGADLPGADDNASGTAGLLELARLLGRAPPKIPVVLVAFANEEPPYFGSEQMGSAVHASSLAAGGRPVAGMICLEMIGYFRGEQRWNSWVLSLIYPKAPDFIGVCGGWRDRKLARRVKAGLLAAGARAVSFTGPREMLDASDHRNYWLHGWPAVIVTDTAYLRNPNYHTAHDTAETLDYSRMAGVVDGVAMACCASTP